MERIEEGIEDTREIIRVSSVNILMVKLCEKT